jgi:hypothetical protein
MAAIFALDTGKPVLKDATIKEPIDHLSHIGPEGVLEKRRQEKHLLRMKTEIKGIHSHGPQEI